MCYKTRNVGETANTFALGLIEIGYCIRLTNTHPQRYHSFHETSRYILF